MPTIDDLLTEIFDAQRPALYAEFAEWVRTSRRFRAFATTYRTKIRAKLKNVNDDSRMQDLRAELATAALLLREERFTLEYEKYAATKQRGPDFTVTFKTHTPFNVEVRRLRSAEWDIDADPGADADVPLAKLTAVLCDKVGQMPPSIINLLWLVAERDLSEADLNRAVLSLRQLADRKVEDFFTHRGYKSAADYLRHEHHLSGIVVRPSGEPVLWLNTLARHPVPPPIVTALQRLVI